MDHAVEAAVRVGHRHPEPVLDLEELVSQVEGSLGTLPPESRTLDAHLRSRADELRVLDPWRGPLRAVDDGCDGNGACRKLLEAHGLPRRAFVVTARPLPGARTRDRIREGVAAFARVADDGSLRSLLRVARVRREERALRARRSSRGSPAGS